MSWRGKFLFVAAIGLFFVMAELSSRSPSGARVEQDHRRALMRFEVPDSFGSRLGLPDQDGDGLTDFAVLSKTKVGVDWSRFIESFRITPDYWIEHYTLYSSASGKVLRRWDGLGREDLAVHVLDGGLCVHARHKKVERCLGPDFCTKTYPKNGVRASYSAEVDVVADASQLLRFEGEDRVLAMSESLSTSLFEGRLDLWPGKQLKRLLIAQGDEYSLYGTTGGTTYVVELARDGLFSGRLLAEFDAPRTIGSWGGQELAAAEQGGRYLLARAIMDSSAPYPVTLLTKVEGAPMLHTDLDMHMSDFGIEKRFQAMAASGCGAWGTGSTDLELIPIADQDGDEIDDWQLFVSVDASEGVSLAISLISGATGKVLER
jgi:hypothetical protein